MFLIKLFLSLIYLFYEFGVFYLYEWNNEAVKSNKLQISNSISEIKNIQSINGVKFFIFKNAKYYPKKNSNLNKKNELFSEKISVVWKNVSNRIIFLSLDFSYIEHALKENNTDYKEHFENKDPFAEASRLYTHLLLTQSDSAMKPRQLLTPLGFYSQLFMKLPIDTTQIVALKPGEVYLKEINLREFYGNAFDSDFPRSFWISVIYDNHRNKFFPVLKGEYYPRNTGKQIFIPTWTGVIESNPIQLDVR